MSALSGDLRERWSHLWHRLHVPAEKKTPLFDPLIKAYESPDRAYHNLHHIGQCLADLDVLRNACNKPDEVEVAIWYHDVVYDAKRHDNEERSADQAVAGMQRAGIEQRTIDDVTALILVTKHTTLPAAGDTQIIVDIDLSILGRPQVEFDAYEQAIRREYAFVDDASFRAGRSAILKKFLERQVIYGTRFMRQKYESAARANLQRSIARLAAPTA